MSRLGLRAMSVLFLSGLLIGGVLSAPPPSEGATIYTRSASCAGLSFYPTDSRTEYDNQGTLRVVRSGDNPNGTGVFRCDPGLPNGAVVKKVQFTVLLTNGLGVSVCALRRSGLAINTATDSQDLARVAPVLFVTPSGTPATLTDSTITYATINNALYGYWLECQLSLPTSWGLEAESGLYGANVIYTISSTKG